MVANREMPGCKVEVAWTTPPRTRPSEVDGWTRVDGVASPRSLTVARGARLKVAEMETATATAILDNRARALDPSNASSPYAPNVKPRRRIRFTLEPEGDTDRTVYTGFVERWPIEWEVGDGVVEVTATDLLALVHGDTLPPSVLHLDTLASGPVHYWSMTETVGSIAEDLAGTLDLSLLRPITASHVVVPFDPRPIIEWKRPDDNDATGQRAIGTGLNLSDGTMTIAMWVMQTGDFLNSSLIRIHPGDGSNDGISFGTLEASANILYGSANGLGLFGGVANVDTLDVPTLQDKGPHRLVFTIDGTSEDVGFYVDGQAIDIDPFADADFSAINVNALVAACTTVDIGWGTVSGGTSINAAGAVGHVTIWDRVLTQDEIDADLVSATNPWAGDRTDVRLERILDLIGVDADDRDIEEGTQSCGPATLGGEAGPYLAKLVATEQGALYVDGDGRIAFRARPGNAPTPIATLVGNPEVDAGVPYSEVHPDYSLDRVTNIAEVTRENGTAQRSENTDSIEEWGPSSVNIETLHQSPAGSRGVGVRITARNGDPILVLSGVELAARRGDVPLSVLLDLDLSDPVTVVARPTGGGDPIDQLSLVERIEHELDWINKDWRTVLGLVESVVLPPFVWDTADQGWGESVWSTP